MKVVAGEFEVTTFGLRERSYLSIFAEKRRKAHFFVEAVTLPSSVPVRYPLLNDLKLCGSRGLVAAASRARLFGTVDASTHVVVITANVSTGEQNEHHQPRRNG
jgi:hypothetical protein